MFKSASTEVMQSFLPHKTVYRAKTIQLAGNLVLAIKWTDGPYYRRTFGKPHLSLLGFTASIYRKPVVE